MRVATALILACWCIPAAVSAPWQPFCALSISADGGSLATGGMAGEVLWWESETGEVRGRWKVGTEVPVAGLAFDSTGKQLVIVLLDGSGASVELSASELLLLPRESPVLRAMEPDVQRWKASGPPVSGVSRPSSAALAQGFPDGRITCRSPSLAQPLSWQAHAAAVTGLVWSPDGAILYSCSYDGSLAKWDALTGSLFARL